MSEHGIFRLTNLRDITISQPLRQLLCKIHSTADARQLTIWRIGQNVTALRAM